ncbi:hypothetical protein F4818DRAFT_268813 [Hypoxylon cercidicola]|nr:hypothetical protein F4818DRAFT_268813 [Hypoxylon cercidicola]
MVISHSRFPFFSASLVCARVYACATWLSNGFAYCLLISFMYSLTRVLHPRSNLWTINLCIFALITIVFFRTRFLKIFPACGFIDLPLTIPRKGSGIGKNRTDVSVFRTKLLAPAMF